jgi:hypothetical protein
MGKYLKILNFKTLEEESRDVFSNNKVFVVTASEMLWGMSPIEEQIESSRNDFEKLYKYQKLNFNNIKIVVFKDSIYFNTYFLFVATKRSAVPYLVFSELFEE